MGLEPAVRQAGPGEGETAAGCGGCQAGNADAHGHRPGPQLRVVRGHDLPVGVVEDWHRPQGRGTTLAADTPADGEQRVFASDDIPQRVSERTR